MTDHSGRGAAAARGSRRAVVVFVDDNTWEAFSALAGALRCRGVGVRRVTVPPRDLAHRAMALLERLVYGRTFSLVQPSRGAGAPATVDTAAVMAVLGHDTIDLQAQDDLAYALLDTPDHDHSAMNRGGTRDTTRPLYDKAVMQALAESIGVAVPKLYTDADEIEYPVVVKAPIGFGGNRVRVVRDAHELAATRAELKAMIGRDPLIQAYHNGGQINVGAVAANGKVLVAVAYLTRPSANDPLGPPSACVALDRADVICDSAALLGTLSYTGFACLNFITDEQDQPHLIDFNPRAFGSWPALQSLGADFLGAYLHAIGLGPPPQTAQLQYGVIQDLPRFPASAQSRSELKHWRRTSTALIKQRGHLLGWRWTTLSTAKIIATTVRETIQLSGGITRRSAQP